ncbi:phage-related membrane protein [Pandoraea communis]|uniref:Phage-related membrane protein n=1 Tax=Pandoraea communis TaxID=2508297 RepID=A0A5E4XKQ4_9BURK|nr:major capsid protein [Pandoraea communis]VVE37021.1 phage-related membrane protein [Pandoraea communis]
MKTQLARLKRQGSRAIAGLALVAVPALAFAEGGGGGSMNFDVSAITGQISFASVATGVIAIAGLLAGVYVAIKSAKVILGMIRGA